MKYCLNCGKELNSQVKKFCDNKCEAEYQYHKYIEEWKQGNKNRLRGHQVSNYVRRYLLEKYNYKCEICGWGEINPYTRTIPLEIHHKDGNYLHSVEDNLMLLCPNCHSLTEHFKGNNKKNDSNKRDRKKYFSK